MKSFVKLVVANLMLISVAGATTFQPVSLNKMLAPTNAIILGDYLDSDVVQLEDGTIATEARFKLEKEWGIEAEEYGISEIKVFFPGGITEGRGLRIEGSPRFVAGEKNVLLLSQQEDGRLWIQGLAMGTFKVMRIGNQSLLINPVFPSHPELSQIPLEKFLRKVSEVKLANLKDIHSDKYVRELEKDQNRVVHYPEGNSRSIASTTGVSDNRHEPNVLDSFWLVTMLAIMGVLTAWRARRKMR